MSQEAWHKGYQEVKNVIHNEIGITKEEILEIFRQVAKDEIQIIVSEKRTFIYNSIKEVIRHEMMNVTEDHNYPRVRKSIWNYTQDNSFKDYITGVMKEEIVDSLRSQFNFKFDIDRKEEV